MDVLEILTMLLAIFSGIAGVPLIQFVKNRIGITSDAAGVGLAGVIAALLSVPVAVASGAVGVEAIGSVDGLFGSLPVIFSVATAVFKLIGGNETLS